MPSNRVIASTTSARADGSRSRHDPAPSSSHASNCPVKRCAYSAAVSAVHGRGFFCSHISRSCRHRRSLTAGKASPSRNVTNCKTSPCCQCGNRPPCRSIGDRELRNSPMSPHPCSLSPAGRVDSLSQVIRKIRKRGQVPSRLRRHLRSPCPLPIRAAPERGHDLRYVVAALLGTCPRQQRRSHRFRKAFPFGSTPLTPNASQPQTRTECPLSIRAAAERGHDLRYVVAALLGTCPRPQRRKSNRFRKAFTFPSTPLPPNAPHPQTRTGMSALRPRNTGEGTFLSPATAAEASPAVNLAASHPAVSV